MQEGFWGAVGLCERGDSRKVGYAVEGRTILELRSIRI